MQEVVNAVFSLPALGLCILIFGFAPGAVLRFILLAFPSDDPRRNELKAELYAVPRLERPFWVAEQVEVALAEGLWPRIVWAASGRIIKRWRLGSGVKAHAEYPETFWIPSGEEKDAVRPGYSVQLSFNLRRGGERMWVIVTEIKERKLGKKRLVGVLDNDPLGIPRLSSGQRIKFGPEHILQIHPPDWEPESHDDEPLSAVCPCCFRTRNEPE